MCALSLAPLQAPHASWQNFEHLLVRPLHCNVIGASAEVDSQEGLTNVEHPSLQPLIAS